MPATRNGLSTAQRAPRVIASPRARRAMRQRGVDPASIPGTGPNGRIVEADVLRAGSAQASRGGPVDARSCFTLRAVADLTTLTSLQRQIADQVYKLCGTPLRLGDLVLRAMAVALDNQPEADRIPPSGEIAGHPGVCLGLEVQAPGGRRVLTVIDRADRLRLIELVRRRAEVEEAARSGDCPAAGSRCLMCLWDLSDQPVDQCAPAVAPQADSVLAVGRAAPRPHVVGGQLVIRQTVWLSLSADERVMSPAPAAALLGRIVELLERPFVLICDRPPWQS